MFNLGGDKLDDQWYSLASASGNCRRVWQRSCRAAGSVMLAVALGVVASANLASPVYASGSCTGGPSGWRQVAISPDYGEIVLRIFRSPDNIRVMAVNTIRASTLYRTEGWHAGTFA